MTLYTWDGGEVTVEQMWDRFIAHLNATQPLTKDKLPHKNFLGSIGAYRKVFIESQNKEGME